MLWYQYDVIQGYKWSWDNINGHSGVDIGMPVGTPLTAPVGGVIVGADYHAWGGQVDIKFLSGGVTKIFTMIHLSQIASGIKLGMTVTAGKILGYSGGTNSGAHPTAPRYSNVAHTHVELTYGDIPPYTTYQPIHATPDHHPLDVTPLVNTIKAHGIANDESATTPPPAGVPGQGDPLFSMGNISALSVMRTTGQSAHQLLVEVPGFLGICLALDQAEHFSAYDPGFNPLGVPGYTVQWVVKNGLAFFLRAGLVIIGVFMILALVAAVVHLNQWLQEAGTLAVPLAI